MCIRRRNCSFARGRAERALVLGVRRRLQQARGRRGAEACAPPRAVGCGVQDAGQKPLPGPAGLPPPCPPPALPGARRLPAPVWAGVERGPLAAPHPALSPALRPALCPALCPATLGRQRGCPLSPRAHLHTSFSRSQRPSRVRLTSPLGLVPRPELRPAPCCALQPRAPCVTSRSPVWP